MLLLFKHSALSSCVFLHNLSIFRTKLCFSVADINLRNTLLYIFIAFLTNLKSQDILPSLFSFLSDKKS